MSGNLFTYGLELFSVSISSADFTLFIPSKTKSSSSKLKTGYLCLSCILCFELIDLNISISKLTIVFLYLSRFAFSITLQLGISVFSPVFLFISVLYEIGAISSITSFRLLILSPVFLISES